MHCVSFSVCDSFILSSPAPATTGPQTKRNRFSCCNRSVPLAHFLQGSQDLSRSFILSMFLTLTVYFDFFTCKKTLCSTLMKCWETRVYGMCGYHPLGLKLLSSFILIRPFSNSQNHTLTESWNLTLWETYATSVTLPAT